MLSALGIDDVVIGFKLLNQMIAFMNGSKPPVMKIDCWCLGSKSNPDQVLLRITRKEESTVPVQAGFISLRLALAIHSNHIGRHGVAS
jgi:hypothetical protein